MQKNENPIVLSAVLLVISLVVALLLAFTNTITKDKIAQNTEKEQTLAKQEVMPEATEFEDMGYSNGSVTAVYQAISGDSMVGWCVSVMPNGYGGAIDLMVGINPDMSVSGIKVVSNSETAGLGAKCTDAEFSKQFINKKSPVSVIKNGNARDNEIVAITGATITSRAVVQGVNDAIDAVKATGGGMND